MFEWTSTEKKKNCGSGVCGLKYYKRIKRTDKSRGLRVLFWVKL
jgi:hypothetical protein